MESRVKEKSFVPIDVFERITDAFFALDKNLRYVYVNQKAGEISEHEPSFLIGKNIWEEFPEDVGTPFYYAVIEAMQKQKYVYLENHYKGDRWFENHIYPSPEGISIYFRNITEKKKMEIALKSSEEKYRLIIEQSNDGIFISDNKGNLIEVNSAACKLSGYDKNELLTKTLFDLAPDKQKANEAFNALQKNQSISFEGELLKEDQSVLQVEISTQLTPDGEVVVFSRDITARKKAEQELREAEQKFRNLVERSLVGVYIVQDGKFAYVNPKLAEEYGYTQEELIGTDITIFAGDDEEETKKVMEHIRARLAGEKESVQYEATGRRKDGSAIDVEVFGSKTQYKGRPAIIGTLINITQRKHAEEKLRQSEQKYKLLFEGNPLPMWMFSKENYSVIDVNDAACKHYGYTREEFLKLNIRDIRPVEDVPFFIEKVKVTFTESIYHGTVRHTKKDGTIINVELIAHDINYHGEIARLVLANDITENLAAEEKLKQSYEEIRQLTVHLQNIREEERTHIAREIHDELGQQLTVMKMDVAWINDKLATANQPVKEKLDDLMSVLDGTVKSVRRIASELRPSLLDDLGLIAAIEWHLKEFEKRSGIATKFKKPVKELSLNETIKTGLFRILQESLTNVARHSKAKTVKIKLLKKKDHIVLQIEDDGIGFDKEKASKKKTLGILGMKERSAMMEGNYEITSIAGKGTSVVVSVRC